MRGLVRSAVTSPAGLLLVVWSFALGIFAFGPVHYNQPPRTETWLFVGGCLVLFCLSSWLGTRSSGGLGAAPKATPIPVDGRRIDLIIRATAVIGLFGALCIVVDKMVLSGLDFSHGVTAVRFARERAVDTGTALALPRSPLLYLGYVTFPFSVASYLLYLLQGESVRRATGLLAFACLGSPFVYSYVYGGRSPLFLVLGMAGGAVLVRLLGRQSPFPRGWTAPALFAAFVALTFAYSTWIVSERFVATGAGDYSALESRFETTYDATIVPIAPVTYTAKVPVEPSSPADGSPSLSERMAMHTVLYTYYVSHELPMLDRTVAYSGPLGPYYGAYQFYLAAAFVERVVPAWNIDAVMIPQLKAANVYGWFSTAWGGMYLDFGLVGALIAVLICGWLAGHVYRSALIARTDGGRLLMCYVLAGIIATPILSIFTISISLPILVSLLITAYALRPARLWPLRAPIPSGAPAPAP